jgi:hypothetical protein
MPLTPEKREAIIARVANHINDLPDFQRRRLWQRLQFPAGHTPVHQRVAGLPEQTLVDWADYLDIDAQPQPGWPIDGLRIFVSHSAAARGTFEELEAAFATLGANFFLAHDDIEGGEEWRAALLRALSSMDALVTIHSTGFSQSPWTNQEVGYALARDVPIVPIINSEVPAGFLAQIQGFRWQAGQEAQLARNVFQRLNLNDALQPKLGEGLANMLKRSGSYGESDRIVDALSMCRRFSERALRAINLACSFNDQVHQSSAETVLSARLEELGYQLVLSPQVQQPPVVEGAMPAMAG